MSEQNSDTKGCVGCVVLIFVLGAAAFYFGPGLFEWNKKRNRTNAVDAATKKALDRVPEFLAARRVKGQVLSRIRDTLDFPLWSPPEGMKEPPPVGSLAGRIILWQERPRNARAKATTPPVEFRWQFDLEIDTIGTSVSRVADTRPRIRRTLSHADEIRARIEAELPPTLRLAPDSFTLIHQEPDVRPPQLLRVIPPQGQEYVDVYALLGGRGLKDPDAPPPELRFVVVRAETSTSLVGRYTDGVPARSGTIKATFFLVPSHACLGTHTVTWSPPQYKSGRGGFNPERSARLRFDGWLQKTHGYGKPIDPFLPEMLPPPVAKPRTTPAKRKRNR